MNNTLKPTIAIVGSIGVGKSAVIDQLEKILPEGIALCAKEPIEKWSAAHGGVLYNDAIVDKQNVELFQQMVTATLGERALDISEKAERGTNVSIIITERCLDDIVEVFVPANLHYGFMKPKEADVCKSVVNVIKKSSKIHRPTYYIFLRTLTAETVIERCKQRRKDLQSVPDETNEEYMKTVWDRYEDWFQKTDPHFKMMKSGIDTTDKDIEQVAQAVADDINDIFKLW